MTGVGEGPTERPGTLEGAVSRGPQPRPGPPRDPRLPHQAVIQTGEHGRVEVSCNCRKAFRGLKGSGGKHCYEPMGHAPDFPTLLRVFNNPENHVEAIGQPLTEWAGLRVPFGKEWMLDGLSGQGI